MRPRSFGEMILTAAVAVIALVLGFVLFGVFLVVLLGGGAISYLLGRRRRRSTPKGVIDVDYEIE